MEGLDSSILNSAERGSTTADAKFLANHDIARSDVIKTSRSQCRSQCLHIADRGLTKEAFVFPIELAWTFVPHREGYTRSIELVDKHLLPSGAQAQLLLVLKRAHGCECTEMVMQRRSAHPRQACQFLDL